MSVYLSCEVTATGSDDLVESFVNQVKAKIPTDRIDGGGKSRLVIGGPNYDARHDLLAIAECFDGLPLTIDITMIPEQQAIYRTSVDCLTGTVTHWTEDIHQDELTEEQSVALG